MAAQMTFEDIKESCVANGGFRTPCLNDKLYLHFKGYGKIENLDAFTAARCIWLESNGLTTIENLEPTKETLRQLFLQQNAIQKIGTGLDELTELVAINLSENFIKKVEGLSTLTKLSTLQLAQNSIETYEDLEELTRCPSISSIELNKNKIEDPRVVDILARMPNLKVLKLDGNPITRKVSHYRKSIIVRCKNLTYLDDRPVFPEERLMAEAWGRGGIEAEKQERTRQRKLREWTEKNRHKQFFDYIAKAKKERRAQNKSVENKGWQPVNGEQLAAADPPAVSKEREVLRSNPVQHTELEVDDQPEGQVWALPRVAKCEIREVTGEVPMAEKKSSRDQKRASRQARLKKAMELVETEKTSEQPAAPKTKKLLIEEVDSSEQPAAPKTKKLLIEEVDSSEQPAASKTKKLLIEEVDNSVGVIDKDALKQAAKEHAQQKSQHAGECSSKWKKEMDGFSVAMATEEDEMEPDLPMSDLDETQVVDLDELD